MRPIFALAAVIILSIVTIAVYVGVYFLSKRTHRNTSTSLGPCGFYGALSQGTEINTSGQKSTFFFLTVANFVLLDSTDGQSQGIFAMSQCQLSADNKVINKTKCIPVTSSESSQCNNKWSLNLATMAIDIDAACCSGKLNFRDGAEIVQGLYNADPNDEYITLLMTAGEIAVGQPVFNAVRLDPMRDDQVLGSISVPSACDLPNLNFSTIAEKANRPAQCQDEFGNTSGCQNVCGARTI